MHKRKHSEVPEGSASRDSLMRARKSDSGMLLRKGDSVLVLSGKAKGKQGRVLRVNASTGTAIVEPVSFTKKEGRQTAGEGTGTAASKLLELANSGTPTALMYVLLLGFKMLDVANLLDRVNQGLRFDSYETLKGNLGISSERMLEVLDIPRRTLLRRKMEGRFSPAESDRLVRLSRVFAKALVLFEGDRDATLEWLEAPRPALGNVTPFSLIASEVGGREVEALIDRLEYGVFS